MYKENITTSCKKVTQLLITWTNLANAKATDVTMLMCYGFVKVVVKLYPDLGQVARGALQIIETLEGKKNYFTTEII